MLKKASDLISYARSLADLKTSKAITYQDELNALNTAYLDIYNNLTEADDDYYIKELTYTNIGSYALDTPSNYLMPLPADFYKIRTVDYLAMGQWSPMSRLPLNMRDSRSTEPFYRIRGSGLWVVFGTLMGVSEIKISYYPAPATLSLPDYKVDMQTSIGYNTDIYNQWCLKDENSIIKTNTSTLLLYSVNKSIPTTLYVDAGAVSSPTFYRGLIFYYSDTSIKFYDPVSNTASEVATGIDPTYPYSISGSSIYYIKSGATYSNSYLGGSETLFDSGIKTCVSEIGPSAVAFLEAGSVVVDNVVIDTDATYMSYPYYNKGSDVYKIEEDAVLWKEGTQIGAQWEDRIIAKDVNTNSIYLYSTFADTNLEYPVNALWEIVSYQAAIDFKRKYDDVNDALEQRKMQMWDTFLNTMIKRDAYKPEKVQNAYNFGNWGVYGRYW